MEKQGIEKVLEDFIENGANIEHDRWARWQKYMFSKGVVGPDGEFHLPEKLVDRWFRQIDTSYSELSESEKESDRKETRNYLPFLRSAIETAFKEVSTADFSRQTARIFKNEAHQRGYIAALSDYDQAVDKFLGK